MSDKFVKIPSNFFNEYPIRTIIDIHDGASIVLLYLDLLCSAYRKRAEKGVFSICGIELTDEVLSVQFHGYRNISDYLSTLSEYGLIERNKTSIRVVKFWQEGHNRNSDRYREWRKSVFERDGYICRKCETNKDLQAHHIKPWSTNKELRYDVSNGITLCRNCHLIEHGGRWNNV